MMILVFIAHKIRTQFVYAMPLFLYSIYWLLTFVLLQTIPPPQKRTLKLSLRWPTKRFITMSAYPCINTHSCPVGYLQRTGAQFCVPFWSSIDWNVVCVCVFGGFWKVFSQHRIEHKDGLCASTIPHTARASGFYVFVCFCGDNNNGQSTG